jgi:hypothetical protein
MAVLQNELDETYDHLQRAVDLMFVGKLTHASVGVANLARLCSHAIEEGYGSYYNIQRLLVDRANERKRRGNTG